jgi:glycosyltransferase involved in cell wall biosynthesis
MRKLNLFGPLNATGMGTHFYSWARELVPMMTRAGVEVTVTAKGGNSRQELFGRNIIEKDGILLDAVRATHSMSHQAPGILMWHPKNLSEFAGSPRIGYVVFEGSKLRKAEIHHLEQVDFVAVPSRWAGAIVEEQADLRQEVLVWPEGVDTTKFHPPEGDPGELEWKAPDTYTMLNIGKWEKRKGTPLLVEAMGHLANRKNSGIYQHVKLIGVWLNPWLRDWAEIAASKITEAGFKLVARDPLVDSPTDFPTMIFQKNQFRIELLLQYLPTVDHVRELMWAADLGVYPYFAEGWNLPLIETMACGVGCIAPHYSGPTEYLPLPGSESFKARPCYIHLDGGKMALAKDGAFFHGDCGHWQQQSLEALVETIQSTITSPQKAEWAGQHAALTMHNWSWESAATATRHSLDAMGAFI